MAGTSRVPARRVAMRPPPASIGDKHTTAENMDADGAAREDSGLQGSAQSAGNEIDPLGAHAKEAAALVSRLTQIGLDGLNIPLPKCVVLGQQSTGKSSVIEALTGIKTPRDTGTCTRCPLMIDLQPSEDPQAEWHASIYLQQRYRWDPQAKQSAHTKFPGWIQKTPPDNIVFAQTDDPNQLEFLIQRAQQATLSPTQDPQSFLDVSYDNFNLDVHKCLFSPNIVGIRITKHDLPTLSFYDLPGLISQAETEEEEYTVPLVENLVSEYIASPDTLILVTCALENDIANSTAAALARKQHATGRCIGVLTKPDRLPQGSSPKMLTDILDGKRFKLGHGYHVTKNLDQDQIKQRITHQQARMLEEEFFKSQDPWATGLQEYQPRFGILNLQTFLSRQHAKHALAKLPEIQNKIEDRLRGVDEELSHIQETPPHTAVRRITEILSRFSDDVRRQIEGEINHTTWKNTWKEDKTAFYESLTNMQPMVKTLGNLDQGIFMQSLPGGSVDDSIVIEPDSDTADDENDLSTVPDPSPKKKRKLEVSTQKSPSKKSTVLPRARALTVKKSPPTNDNQSASVRRFYDLDKVKEFIDQSSQSKWPGEVHFKVSEKMVIETLESWQMSMDNFFDKLEADLRNLISEIFDNHFSSWRDSELFRAARGIVTEIIENNLHEQKSTMAAETLNDELQGLYIFHEKVFTDAMNQAIGNHKQLRLNARFKIFMEEAKAKGGKALKEETIRKDEKLMSLIRAEPYRREIEVIIRVRTYYELAARRFHDAVCMRIESKFFKQLREKLRSDLDDGLGISNEDGPENAQRLLAESTARFNRRKELVARKNALLEGRRYVTEFQRKCENDNSALHSGSGSSSGSSSPNHPVLTPSVDDMDCA